MALFPLPPIIQFTCHLRNFFISKLRVSSLLQLPPPPSLLHHQQQTLEMKSSQQNLTIGTYK